MSLSLLYAVVWALPFRMAFAESNASIFVEVALAKLRKEPLHWSAPLESLSYGQKLEVLSEERAWVLVRSQNNTGYVHQSAVTSKKVILQGTNNQALLETRDTDVVLAGKGFSAEIESLYQNQNPELDLSVIDRLERLQVDPLSLHRFMQQGHLIDQEAG